MNLVLETLFLRFYIQVYLIEDYRRQASIEFDPKSFGFSTIISDLTPVLEGYDEDPEESFFTEQEFREIIENTATKLEKYSIE
jgi:hypothetical protein